MPRKKKSQPISQVMIGGIPYKVEVIDGLRDDYDNRLWGQLELGQRTIRLEASTEGLMQQVTFWHEAIHAILYHAGYREHDEKLIDVLAFGLVSMYLQNPGLTGV